MEQEHRIAASFVGKGGTHEKASALQEVSSREENLSKLSNFSLGTYAAELPFLRCSVPYAVYRAAPLNL
jgi:hypothetical protein